MWRALYWEEKKFQDQLHAPPLSELVMVMFCDKSLTVRMIMRFASSYRYFYQKCYHHDMACYQLVLLA